MSVEVYLRMIDDDRIRELATPRRDVGEFLWPASESEPSARLSLGKAFGEIDVILQKYSSTDLAAFLTHGGILLGFGEMAATAFVASEVRDIAALVAKVDESVIREHYADEWRRGEPTCTLEEFFLWLLPYFRELRRFLLSAVERGQGILVYASV